MPGSTIAALSLLALLGGCATTSPEPKTPVAAPSEAPEPESALTSTEAPGSEEASAPSPAEASPEADSPQPRRIVAVGDLHADLPDALAVLQMAGVVDASGAWVGGDTVLVQTGDTTDRGPDSKEVIELFMRLEGEAGAAGGEVVALLGNHEVMNLVGDLRYVNPEDVEDFGSSEARAEALGPEGELGRWLRRRGAAAKVGDTVFVHGGITDVAAQVGVDGLNQLVREALADNPRHPVLGEMGPLWYRGYLQADEPIACAEAERALAQLGARRMVMGHTTQRSGRIAVRCGGRLLGIDTGISTHYGDHHAALLIEAGDARALYAQGVEDIVDP